MSENELFYRPLGSKLKALRVKRSETLAEVSGAVEIDERLLQRIEGGQERPSEDVLLLLINHFGLADDSAAELWQLAGYDANRAGSNDDIDPAAAARQTLMVMIDPRVMYSDSVEVVVNPQGVVMNFAQLNNGNMPLPIARLGMSREQAAAVMLSLQQALIRGTSHGQPKRLPPPTA